MYFFCSFFFKLLWIDSIRPFICQKIWAFRDSVCTPNLISSFRSLLECAIVGDACGPGSVSCQRSVDWGTNVRPLKNWRRYAWSWNAGPKILLLIFYLLAGARCPLSSRSQRQDGTFEPVHMRTEGTTFVGFRYRTQPTFISLYIAIFSICWALWISERVVLIAAGSICETNYCQYFLSILSRYSTESTWWLKVLGDWTSVLSFGASSGSLWYEEGCE